MTDHERSVDERLARLGAATEPLRASSGFSARVMQAVEATATPGWLTQVWPTGRRLLPVFAVAAAVAVGWAAQVQGEVDEALAVSYGAVEYW